MTAPCSLCYIALASVSDADTDRIIVGAFSGTLQRHHTAHRQMINDSELDAQRIQICFKFPSRIFLSRPARDCVRACDEGANKSVDGPSKLRNATLARSRT